MSSATPRDKVSIWEELTTVQVNGLNGKCTTLPILALSSQYCWNFHLAWLGFWVAFLSWFAFSPLIPQAIKSDLNLTQAQIGNSNVVSLCSTLIVRIIIGPLVDWFGPRKVMAGLLIVGAIPSGLAGTISSAQGLYVIRFFIGILGGTFVPAVAWTSAFFDKRVVGRANALSGGWGNSGGGFTFIIMLAVYDRLLIDGLSEHVAWRAAFAVVPVPILLTTAAITLIFGTDHPNGCWRDRHLKFGEFSHAERPAHEESSAGAGPENRSQDACGERESRSTEIEENKDSVSADKDKEADADININTVGVDDLNAITSIDLAVNQEITFNIAAQVIASPLTWLPAFAYLTTFGFELAIDANLANVLYDMYKSGSFGQTKAGYIAGIYGLMNILSRPFGGYCGDKIYLRFGVPGKKYLTLSLGILQGFLTIALGLYIDSQAHPELSIVIVIFVILGFVDEMGNGVNFSLVPHCNPNSNGFMTGIVGAMGNLGGVFYALIFRMQPTPYGKVFWISGILTIGVNVLLLPIRVPRR